MNLTVTFRIIPPVAVLKSLSPFVLPLAIDGAAQANPTTFTLSGSNFVSGSTVQVWTVPQGAGGLIPNLNTITVVDANTIQFLFGESCYENSITFAVTVTNPGTAASNPLPLLCGPAEPRIFSVSSAAAPVVFNGTSMPIAPGELVTIGGSDFGTPLGQSAPLNSSSPTTLLGLTQVLFDGVAVPIIYTSENQINAAAPYSINNKTTTNIVVVYNGVSSAPLAAQVVPSAASLFTTDSTGKGQGSILNQDSSLNSPYNPAAAGSTVTLYATGMGVTNPPITDGTAPQGTSATPVLPVNATIGGQTAKVVSAYAAPGLLAVLVANVQIPSSAAAGTAVPVILQIGSSQSQAGVTIAIQ